MAGGGAQSPNVQAGPQVAQAPGQPNVFQQAATGLQGAQQTAQLGTQFQPGQLATTDLTPFQNPFNQQVLDTTLQSIERQRQFGINDVGAAATSVGAFGGSRQGVAEAETNRAAIDAAARASAGIGQAGFNQAQQAAQFDIGTGLQGAQQRLGAAGTLANISNLGFGQGRQINQDLNQVGTQQQAVSQALINAAKQQFGGFVGSPGQSLQFPLAAIGGVPGESTTTQQQQPGLLNYLSLGLGLF
jgi:hypothetical protein